MAAAKVRLPVAISASTTQAIHREPVMSGSHPNKTDLVAMARQGGELSDEELVISKFAQSIPQYEAAEGTPARCQFLRELLRALAEEHREKIESQNYPDSVRQLIHKEFDRIVKENSEKEDEYFDFGNFHLRTDLRLVCFGRIPAGPQHLELGGLPGSVLLRGGLGQGARFLKTVLKAGGRSPFYVLHLAHIWPPAFQIVYSPAEQRKMFHNLAACLEMNTDVRGVQSAGWLFDPQLETVNPQLAYLRTGWTNNGAELFYWERSDSTTRMATMNSQHRGQLHAEGKYDPVGYMVVWLRDSLIAWSRQNRETGETERAGLAAAESH